MTGESRTMKSIRTDTVTEQPRRILVVEDDNDIAQLIALHLRDNDFDVTIASDGHQGMRLAFGRRMGPFETSDLVGLEVQYDAYMNTYNEEQDLKFYPPGILRRKVLANQLGRKTGKGWFEYDADGKRKDK